MNKQLYNDLLNASLVLLKQKRIQNQIRDLKENIHLRERERKESETLWSNERASKYKKKTSWASGLFVCGGLSLFTILTDPEMLMLGLTFGIVFVVIASLLIFSAHLSLQKKTAQDKQWFKQRFDEDNSKNQADNAKISQLSKESVQLLDNGKAFLEILPETYRNAEAVCFMLLAIKDGRADTLKEAINLYEEQLHRWRVENMLQDTLQMQQIHANFMNSAMQEIVNHQESINDSLASMANLQSIQFMQNKF